MAKGPKNTHAAELMAQNQESLPLSAWFTMSKGADQVARRRQVWGLLGFYHHRVALPNHGLAGFLRRLYYRIFGTRIRLGGRTYNMDLIRLRSPWEHIGLKVEHREELLELTRVAEEAEDQERGE